MSDIKVKMHLIWFRLGLRPTPRQGSLQRSPSSPSSISVSVYFAHRAGAQRQEFLHWQVPIETVIDVKKRFLTFFYFCHVLNLFDVFLFSKRFYLKNVGKVQSGKQINK